MDPASTPSHAAGGRIIRFALAIVCVVVVGNQFRVIARTTDQSTDFTQDYLSAQSAFAGRSIYAPNLDALSKPPRDRVNDHPPGFILVLAPLGLLPYASAVWTLGTLNILGAIGAAWLVARARQWNPTVAIALVAAVLIHPGTANNLVFCNISSLLLFTIAWAYWATVRERRGLGDLAGICIGLATAIKLFPGLLVLAFVATRRFRSIAIAALAGGVVLAGAAVAFGLDDLRVYVVERAPENAKSYVANPFNLSIAGAAQRAFGEPYEWTPWMTRAAVRPELATGLTWVGRAVVLLLVAWGLWGNRSAGQPFAVLVPAMLLLSPLTWLHAVPMMIIPVAELASRATTGGRRATLAVCIVAMSINDHALMGWYVSQFGSIPWSVGLLLLAPTWGMLTCLILAGIWKPGHFLSGATTR